jgi:CubicO group peptidase (beta-lactamase class C family)
MRNSARLRLLTVAAAAILVAALGAARAGAGRQSDPTPAAKVDQVFARWTGQTPGCAVGVGSNGRSVLERAYGMADLEHDVRNVPDTIFEAGSVSKQFTAAAVLLLARDGRLSLDDPVRKYIPELPDYGAPLTIRHMLTHTSGLRDWGNVAAIAGWPRTSRVHTHAHVLDIVSRQRSLNFPPGTRYSYSNTGYNLAAILVSRVSGERFADFSRQRIFEPLGLTRTSWRDDHTRIVRGRATAYADARDGFRINMPFENVHGNGGLLTTVGDLLRWTANFSQPKVGDAGFVREQQEPGRFSDGVQHDYALGLRIAPYKGMREVGHSGSTAGYRAYVADYPDQRVSVAVLCNVSSGNATQYAHAVADIYLGSAIVDQAGGSRGQRAGDGGRTVSSYALTPADLDAAAGLYRDVTTGEPLRIVKEGSGLRLEGGAALQAESGSRFTAAAGRTVELEQGGRLRVIDQFRRADVYERVAAADLESRAVADYAGTYSSDEAEVTYKAAVRDGSLVLERRPDAVLRLTPVYADGFRAQIGFVRFTRDGSGRVTGFHVSQDRVWKLVFDRQPGSDAPSSR